MAFSQLILYKSLFLAPWASNVKGRPSSPAERVANRALREGIESAVRGRHSGFGSWVLRPTTDRNLERADCSLTRMVDGMLGQW